jgi:hypothetical protein
LTFFYKLLCCGLLQINFTINIWRR